VGQVRRAHQARVPGPPTQFQLQVIVTTRVTPGFVVHAAGRSMAPGCREAGGGGAVPKLGDVYIFNRLTRLCDHDQVVRATILEGDARHHHSRRKRDYSMQALVSTIDALRRWPALP
jgi:hypothetical protein